MIIMKYDLYDIGKANNAILCFPDIITNHGNIHRFVYDVHYLLRTGYGYEELYYCNATTWDKEGISIQIEIDNI